MKYRNKKYKWFVIIFEDDQPEGVILYSKDPYNHGNEQGKITTYWDNEQLTEKPLFYSIKI